MSFNYCFIPSPPIVVLDYDMSFTCVLVGFFPSYLFIVFLACDISSIYFFVRDFVSKLVYYCVITSFVF
jgi:hypothetical protein